MQDNTHLDGCVLCIGEGEEIANVAYELENHGFSVLRARYLDDISRSAAPFSILAFVITGDPEAPTLCRRLRANIRYAFTPLFVLAQTEASLRLSLVTAGADDCGPFPQGYLAQAIRARHTRSNSMSRALQVSDSDSRQTLVQMLPREIARARRYNSMFCLALVEVDRSKDAVLFPSLQEALVAAVGEAFRYGLRDADVFSQLGPAEFLLLLPHANSQGAKIALERCQQLLQGISLEGHPKHRGSFSAGITPLQSKDKTPQDLLQRASHTLQLAKQKSPGSILLAL